MLNLNKFNRKLTDIIAYVLCLGDEEKEVVLKGMRHLEKEIGCVSFEEWSNQLVWVRLRKEKKGCFASVGRRPFYIGPLPLNFQSPECLKHDGTVHHELLHVLGLYHEQSRPDRDQYVDIIWDNVKPGR